MEISAEISERVVKLLDKIERDSTLSQELSELMSKVIIYAHFEKDLDKVGQQAKLLSEFLDKHEDKEVVSES